MEGTVEQVLGKLQEAVVSGLVATRKRFNRQDLKIRDLERRVYDLETCVAHFIKKENDEQQL